MDITTLSNFHLIRPQFLWLALGIVLFILIKILFNKLVRAQIITNRQDNSWQNICAPEILQLLYKKHSSQKKSSLMLLHYIFWSLIIIALAGPTWHKKESIVYQNQNSWIIALSLSPSMEKTDISPSRLQRAKYKIQDFNSYINDEQLGLIAFNEEAYDIIPLTNDKKTIEHILPSIEPLIMPSKGDNINSALVKAKELIKNLNLKSSNILIFTDSNANSESLLTAKQLSQDNIGIYIINLDSTSTAAPSLKELSSLSGGLYQRLTNDDQDIENIISHAKQRYDLIYNEQASEDRTELWQDMGPWLVLLSLPLLLILLSSYRNNFLSFLIISMCSTLMTSLSHINVIYASVDKVTMEPNRTSEPSFWQKIFLNEQQIAAQQIQNNQTLSQPATQIFKNNSNWQAAAEYKQKNFQRSADLLAKQYDPLNRYNYANSLAQQGNVKEAIRAYDEVLNKDPNFADAKHNKDLLENYLKSKKQQNNNNSDNSNKSDKNKDQDEPQQNPSANSNPSDSQSEKQNPSANKPQSEPQQENNTNTQDKAQQNPDKSRSPDKTNQEARVPPEEKSADAKPTTTKDKELDKWLDKIPDNPATYLRNQLQYEYWQKRQLNTYE